MCILSGYFFGGCFGGSVLTCASARIVEGKRNSFIKFLSLVPRSTVTSPRSSKEDESRRCHHLCSLICIEISVEMALLMTTQQRHFDAHGRRGAERDRASASFSRLPEGSFGIGFWFGFPGGVRIRGSEIWFRPYGISAWRAGIRSRATSLFGCTKLVRPAGAGKPA